MIIIPLDEVPDRGDDGSFEDSESKGENFQEELMKKAEEVADEVGMPVQGVIAIFIGKWNREKNIF